jgi:hypothetical protein
MAINGAPMAARGKPFAVASIEQLARDMIELSCLRPDVDSAIEETRADSVGCLDRRHRDEHHDLGAGER